MCLTASCFPTTCWSSVKFQNWSARNTGPPRRETTLPAMRNLSATARSSVFVATSFHDLDLEISPCVNDWIAVEVSERTLSGVAAGSHKQRYLPAQLGE